MPSKILDESKVRMEVSEVMTSTVISIPSNVSVEFAAKQMLDSNVGSIIIAPVKGENQSLGIITERDIVTRVVAYGKNPAKTTVNEIATRPVITIPPTLNVTEAMTLMAKMNIRRLIIAEDNEIIGNITYRDLLKIAPSLLEIALEYEKIGFGNSQEENELEYHEEDYDADSPTNSMGLSLGFYCSQCGDWCEGSPSGEIDEQPVCDDCYHQEE
ncbi:MAG: cyclic nucleotide-binding/CBS domain-containing protein [Candidatus Thorarchaeota archaeon]